MNDLTDQRDFLLRSLEDLERERAAGDVDEHDYATLKDDYTARAAAVLRAMESGGASEPAPAASSDGRPRRRRLAVGAGVVVFAVLAGVLVAQSAGRRDAGQSVTGDVRQSVTQRLNAAGQRGSQGDYAGALAIYRGWMLVRAGKAADGLTQLLSAATAHPDYPDVHAFLAIVFFQSGLVKEAGDELDRLDALDPPAFVRGLVSSLRAQIDAALASTTTSTTQPGGGT